MRNTEYFCARYKNEIYLFPRKPHFEADIYTTQRNFPMFTARLYVSCSASQDVKSERENIHDWRGSLRFLVSDAIFQYS